MSPKTIVFITGANSGIGYETAKALLASPDFHVLLGSRDDAKGAAALKALLAGADVKGTASLVQIDITDVTSVEKARAKVTAEQGHIDVLVNNAAIYHVDDTTPLPEALTGVLATNVVGTARVTEAFLPLLSKAADNSKEGGAEKKSRLLFVTTAMASFAHCADPSSRHFGPWATAYRASKAAENMLMVQLAAKLGGPGGGGITVLGVDPGFCATNVVGNPEMLRQMGAAEPPVGGTFVASVVRGERDADAGKIVEAGGVGLW